MKSKVGTFTTTTDAKSVKIMDLNSIVEALGSNVTIKSLYLQVASDDSASKVITVAVSTGSTDVVIHAHTATNGATTYAKIENGDELIALSKTVPVLKVNIPALTSGKIITINYMINYF
jgi:hypothetical protein